MAPKHDRFFTYNKISDTKVIAVAEVANKNRKFERLETKYIEKISSFIERYPIDVANCDPEIIRQLINNYWRVLLLLGLDTKWKESTYELFINSSIRIIEFVIYLCHINKVKYFILFLGDIKERSFFEHFRKISNSIDGTMFAITHNKKLKHNEVTLSENESYKSEVVIQSKGENNQESDFSFYFKLHHESVLKIYNLKESDGNTGKGGHQRHVDWKRVPFIDKENYLQKLISSSINAPEKENSFEIESRKKKIHPLQLDNSDLIFGEELEKKPNLNIINFSSQYKRYLINKAIGLSIAKQNMTLKSDYAIPELEILSDIFVEIVKEDSLASILLLLTVVFGFRTEKLVYAIAGFDNNINYVKRESKIRIDAIKGIFAKYNIEDTIAKNSKKDKVEIFLPEIIVRLWEKCNQFIRDRFDRILIETLESTGNDLYEFSDILEIEIDIKKKYKYIMENSKLSEESKEYFYNLPLEMARGIENEARECLKRHIDSYPKKVSLKYETLPVLFLHLFRTQRVDSDIHLLFSGQMRKNDEARICYASVPPRLLHYEAWQIELIETLKLDKALHEKYGIETRQNVTPYEQTDRWVGSRLYIKGGYFKGLLLEILGLNFDNQLDQGNVRMLFIKYSLSCLIAARSFNNSLSMEQFSKREKLLFIQEKGKNLISGKRIIPLSDAGVFLVEKFLEMRSEFNLHSYSPCFIEIDDNNNRIERPMNKNNILEWLAKQYSKDNSENKMNIESIKMFVEKVPLNFGRHIFTSYATQSSDIESQYIDAFLNHYKMGTEDQGIYSCFDNEKYRRQVVNIIEEIEQIYFPRGWKKLW